MGEHGFDLFLGLTVFILAGFVGFEVIRRVPQMLHTPLMSLTNALSGIALIGSVTIVATSESTLATVLGTIAIVASTINVVGGFWITDRMLRMFKQRTAPRSAAPERERGPSGDGSGAGG